ncbi:MAG: tRNA uridine-5-carboxymethylaminomethyl(34) synthesis enzyme MnmG [Phycisphaerales bacterium]|nr:tRNA uridine-5-carboxymethylaminomethyl(34) synthesis enzyme MnmG [Phycisphaerales bacterium]
MPREYRVIVIGGGHAGVEAAWAAANLLPADGRATVALVTLDPSKIGVMSCNPAIGGLAKGQLVREVDALGGLMGLAADATGIQFKVLNAGKGAAVHGPRCQSDKHAYAEAVQRLVASRPEIEVVAGSVEELVVEGGRVRGVRVRGAQGDKAQSDKAQSSNEGRKAHAAEGLDVGIADSSFELSAPAVILTTGTFMRGLMHTGDARTPGGRHGEGAATVISASLRALGFELGRLKTGTPPRLRRGSIDWDGLPAALGDGAPTPFSELTSAGTTVHGALPGVFPAIEQVECRQTRTTPESHALIRENLHRAPMFSGAIESVGPRYCPSIEDKVVRFADRETHGVFLEPESLRDDWVYCNGISTSLPTDVQERVVRAMPGCERAEILRFGYAVEYDMVRPHQIGATGMTKLVGGLFLAGQINGTSGYEEAAAQGLVAGVNAARFALGQGEWVLGREEAYIGVLMDDLVTKTPVEPYRMFTSRAEHRLLLRADNAPDRLTPVARELGLLDSHELGRARLADFAARARLLGAARGAMREIAPGGATLEQLVRQDRMTVGGLAGALAGLGSRLGAPCHLGEPWQLGWAARLAPVLHAEVRYEGYIHRQRAEIKRHAAMERRELPGWLDYASFTPMRTEARAALARFRPATFGQASRLEGVTPADLTLLAVLVERARRAR